MTIDEDTRYTLERRRMVEEQIRGRGIRDERLLQALHAVPRHLFVAPEYRDLAYTDGPLPIGSRQTISQPYIVALMTQMLGLKGDETVLEVGTGSGYQAAVLAHLARQVYSVERHPRLAQEAARILRGLGLENVQVIEGDGSLGLPEHAPYHAILVTAAAPDTPQSLLEQLAEAGRLVLPVGGRMDQYLERWQRHGNEYHQEVLVPVAFVPLRGKHGWAGNEW